MPKHQIVLPNVRKMFVPDSGYVIFDVDLAGADAQVVAAEAEDEDLRAAFKAGLDVHDKNARDLWGPQYSNLAGDKDTGPKSRRRKECKQGVHATNYGGSARTLAVVLGWTVHEADQFQKRWFSIHPGIKRNFHGRIEASIRSTRTVKNRFGYRRVYFDRIEECFTEALAWVPQSTVAEVSFRGALQLEERWDAQYPSAPMVVRPLSSERPVASPAALREGRAGMLLQVHDSLVFQVPRTHVSPEHLKFIKSSLAVPIPYDDPLTIQWGIAMSEKSWGDCENVRI